MNLFKKKNFIDVKVDEAIAKHCYLEKTKYELLPQVVICTIACHVKLTKVDKTQKHYTKHSTHHTT